MKDVFANIDSNIAMWSDHGEEVLGDRLALIKAVPEVKEPKKYLSDSSLKT